MQDNDEHLLIIAALSGDHDAYGRLIDRYKTSLYRHCFCIVRDEDVAEDIAQDTFVAAYYKLNTYNPQYRLSTWFI